MNLRTVKKKLRQEVICDKNGIKNSDFRILVGVVVLLIKVSLGLVATPLFLVLSIYRPIEIWRLQRSRSKLSFFVRDLEFGLQKLQSEAGKSKRFVFALYPIPFPNKQLAKMYRRHIFIIGPKLRWLAEVMRFVLPLGRVYQEGRVTPQTSDRFIRWNKRSVTLSFDAKEVHDGLQLNEKLGLSLDQPYVCLAFSSKRYRESADLSSHKHFSLGKTDDNLFEVIPTLDSYIPVIKAITERNIAVVRTGLLEDEKLPVGLGPLVYDYSFMEPSPFGDVWLYSRCLFSLAAAGSGSHWFASIFKKPCVFADQFIGVGAYGNNDLFIPQLPWLIRECKIPKLDWLYRKENEDWAFNDSRLGSEYVLRKNTADQIIDVTMEMLSRMDGTWIESPEDKELQTRFRRCVTAWPAHEQSPARIGAKFLREHQHLLPD
jgi:putative glycosyltransferase (TIGR04372 family)